MKMSQITMSIVVFAAAVAIWGCSKDNGSTNPAITTDEAAMQYQIVHSDSIANFLASDESSIDDSTYMNSEYGLAKVNTIVPVVQYGRHIFWSQATRSFSTVKDGDSVAVVTVTTTIPGELLLAVGSRSGGSVLVDSVIQKPFSEVVVRKVRFKRIANTADPELNWLPVAMTLAQGKSTNASAPTFQISSLEFTASSDTIIYDPLASWFRFGRPLHSGIPYVHVNDTITVRVTVESNNDSAEVVNLRHGIDGVELARGRVLMQLQPPVVHPIGGAFAHTRIYQRKFVARNFAIGRPLIRVARFSAIVDVFTYNTLHDDSAAFANEFWGFPYIEVKY
jgi:hypothetical protein